MTARKSDHHYKKLWTLTVTEKRKQKAEVQETTQVKPWLSVIPRGLELLELTSSMYVCTVLNIKKRDKEPMSLAICVNVYLVRLAEGHLLLV